MKGRKGGKGEREGRETEREKERRNIILKFQNTSSHAELSNEGYIWE